MSLLNLFSEYAGKGDQVERAAFDAAMIDYISKHPYSISDVLWELYKCQQDIALIMGFIKVLGEQTPSAPSNRAKPKPKRKR